MKPFCTLEINLLEVIKFSRRFAITAKNILPIVFVRAMGRNSDGSVRFVDFGKSWIDADAQKQKAKAQQIKFGSPEYFALLKKHRDANQYLCNGQNVTVVLDGTLYEITE